MFLDLKRYTLGGPICQNVNITGSDLCFSIRSELLVEEPAGEQLEERGVRGERRCSGSRRETARAEFRFLCISQGKPYVCEKNSEARFVKMLVFPMENQ